MRKIIALLLVLAMLSVCIFAYAEAVDEPVGEGEVALTDEVDEAAEAAEDLEEQQLAEADDNPTSIEEALDSDRKIVAEGTIDTSFEALSALNGVHFIVSGQSNGVNRFTFDIQKEDEQLFKGSISYAEQMLYFQFAKLGEETYCIDASGMASMLDIIPDFLNIGNAEALDSTFATIGKLAPTGIFDFDPSTLHLDPLMVAIFQLNNCVTIIDVDDYQLGVAETEETPLEGDAEAPADEEVTEPIEDIEDGLEPTGETVAMVVNIVLTHDDLAVLTNAIAATIELNPEVSAALGMNAEEFTEYAEVLLEELSEDVSIVLNLDADGRVLYASMDYSIVDMGSYRLQYTCDIEEEGVRYSISTLTTDPETTTFVTTGTVEAYVTESSVLVRILAGDPEDTAFGFEAAYVTPTEESNEYLITFNTITVEGGMSSFPVAIYASGSYVEEGADFTADGTLTVTLDEAETPALFANITVKTEPADQIDLSNAINVNGMDVGEDADLYGTLVTPDNEEITE